MRDVIISDFACSDAVCIKLLGQLWPKDRPLVMTIPATGMSESHRSWVESFRQSHGGKFLEPFIAQKMKWSDVRSISLVGFSAGCWGVREILADPGDADLVSFVYACDGLHGTYVDGRVSIQEPWLRYAARAASGDALMVVSFSSIVPPGYPSTRDSAIELGRQVGAAWLSPAPGGFANCLPSCDADGSVGAQEFGQAGNVVLVGAWPPGTSGTNAAAHVYQANAVQAAVWRTYLAPWIQNQPISGVERGSKSKWSSLLVLGVGLAAFGASVWKLRKGTT